jgi:hypothetical protein
MIVSFFLPADPGRVLADVSIFISCAMSLAVFDISKYMEDGEVIEPVVDQTTGTIRYGGDYVQEAKL